MAEMLTLPLKERLWARLRADLANIAPNLASDDRLICCCCGRLLPYEAFTLEHIIPQQALADDPPAAKLAVPSLNRSGSTLLCNTALKLGGRQVTAHGCNSWKGKHYDKHLRAIFNGKAITRRSDMNDGMLVSAFTAAFLALFSTFGYQVALTQAGSLSRRQFFQPGRFLAEMPGCSQFILMGGVPEFEADAPKPWDGPFSFRFRQDGQCSVAVRNYSVTLPLSRDPRLPIASSAIFAPPKYKMRPDFRVLFD